MCFYLWKFIYSFFASSWTPLIFMGIIALAVFMLARSMTKVSLPNPTEMFVSDILFFFFVPFLSIPIGATLFSVKFLSNAIIKSYNTQCNGVVIKRFQSVSPQLHQSLALIISHLNEREMNVYNFEPDDGTYLLK